MGGAPPPFATAHATATHATAPMHMEQFGEPVAGSMPTVVRAFKSAVTNHINDKRALHAIRRSIQENPRRWHLDHHNARRTGNAAMARAILILLQEEEL